MPDLKKYLKKLDVEPYYAVMGSIKKQASHFLTIQRSYSRNNHLLVLTPEQIRVYELGLFNSASLREKEALAGIQAIRVEREGLLKTRTIYFENEKSIFRVKDLKDPEVDEFVKALMNITHVHPLGEYQNYKLSILSDSLIKSHGIVPTSVLTSVTGDKAHVLLTARELIAILNDGSTKKLDLKNLGSLELRQGAFHLELMAFKPGELKSRGTPKPEYVLQFPADCEPRLRAFCSEVNRLSHDGVTASYQTASHSPQTSAKSSTHKEDIPTQLKQLAELLELGILTQEEFETKKKQLLARM